MAIRVHEYFDRYRRHTLSFFILVHLASSVLACAVAWLLWQAMPDQPLLAFTGSAIALLIINILAAFSLFTIASRPHKLLAQAVAHVSHDPVLTPPPDIGMANHGLPELIQTVYELAVPGTSPTTQTDPQVGFFTNVLANLPAGVVALDAEGRILYANPIAPAIPTSNGMPALTLLFDRADTLDMWLQSARANKLRDTRTWQRIADKLPGEDGQRIFDVTAFYQKDAPGGAETLLVTFDRTAAYAPDQDDMDFIALAAHELRAPITVIRGYLDIFNQEFEGRLNADQQQLLDRLQVSAERLAGYINNILNVSRYDRDQFKVHLQQEDLGAVLASLQPELALRATTQNRRLTVRTTGELPAVATDRSVITEVIVNLVDNAIKYSHPDGEVVIGATPKDSAFVEVTVTDNGIGMPSSVMNNLFSRFYRSHRSKQTVGGTGLGLYICRAIIEAHGGTIWVRSTEGKGSTFGFTLPTYESIAASLKNGDNTNQGITQRSEGWIKNHAMLRK